jgi:hypothetical protein
LVLDAERKARATSGSTGPALVPVEAHQRGPAVDECDPHPLGYHRGSDATHNACAEVMCSNAYPGSDFVIAAKAFDGVSVSREVCEVKTGLMSQYSPQVVGFAFKQLVAGAAKEQEIADRCGYHFVLYVADPDAIDAVRDALRNTTPGGVDVRPADKDECVR